MRLAVPVVVGLLASTVVGLAQPAAAVQQAQSTLVSTVPATNTPDVNDGVVYAIGQVGNQMILGGSFTSVSPHATPGTTYSHPHIVAFDATTGTIDNTNFVPTVNGEVDTIIPGPAANEVYIGGSFTTVDGVAMRVALLNTTTGALVSTWKPSAMNSAVNKLVLSNGQLFAAGYFTSVGGVAHDGLVALDPNTGKATSYVNLQFTGHHNYGTQCDPNANKCAMAAVGVKSIDINPAGTELVAIGNFTDVSGNSRDQVAVVTLGSSAATVDTDWSTDAYTAQCFSNAFDSYIRDVQFSPDGSYFVIVATGGSGSNSDGTNSSCDTAARYEAADTGSDVRPTWIDYTGQDTLWTVAISGTAVYVGGHERWLNNSKGYDYAGPGAVPRPGIAALNPKSGLPLSWNPGRSPRGAGCYALLLTSTGLWEGSDTDYIGNRQYLHKKVAFFPLAGGEQLPDESTPTLPGRVYTAGGFANPAASPVLYRINAGGPTIGAIDNGPDWQGDQSDPSTYRNSGSNTASYSPVPNVDSTVPSTTPSGIFDTERWDPGSNGDGGEMHWEFPVPAGEQVDVRLYFANRCTCTSSPGSRQFDVAIDGASFLTKFDPSAAAGDQTGTMRDEVVTSDGEVTIDFAHEVENPLINGIEIVRQSAPTTYPATMYRIDAGGPLIGGEPGNPADWLADGSDTTGTGTAFRSGGNAAAWADPWDGTVDGSVPSSTPSSIFSYERWAPQTYTFPVLPGTPVNVKLFFANNCGCTSQPGQRQFNVAIDGNQVMSNYDIVADVGNKVGEMKSFDVTAPSSGQVTVALTNGNIENAVINGLQIDQTGATPPPPTTDPDQISYRHFDGTTPGAEQTMSTGIAWGSIRGAFMVNGEVIYGKGDGNLYERSFNGSTFGTEVPLDPYDDPYWDNIQTGSGQTYQGQRSDMAAEMPSVTSMFFTNGRLYYTLKGDSTMHWRWFEPEDGIVGSDEFSVSDGEDWSNVAGAFLSGSTLYFADRTSGALSSVGWNGTMATGTPTVVDATQDWASRGMFLVADATTPNQPPTASFTSTCSSTGTACTFDSGKSQDPDGSIADYSWDFGDGTTQDSKDATVFSHTFPKAGAYTVTLTVTDNDGATDTVSHSVSAGQVAPTPSFGGATTACGPGTGSCGSSNITTVGVPTSTAAGDALLMYVTWPTASTISSSVPSGWQLLGKDLSSPLESDVYYRAATASDVNHGTVQVTFSGATKNSVTLADYKGADPSTIEASAKAADSNTATHVTPTTTVTQPGSLALSYWADKSSSTTAWTPPGSVTTRTTTYDTGGGRVTSLLADSGSTVGTGSYGGLTATTNATSGKGVEWTIILQPAGAAPPNSPPTAAFTSSCSGLTCSFDGTGSSDPEGPIASYAWDFGDGSNGTGATPNHTYATGTTYHVTLTVTDSGGATDQVTHDVTPSSGTTQNIGFVGADTYDASGSSGTVTIPAGVSAGDALLLFESHASTSVTASAPAGWTAVGTTGRSNLTSTVYERTATAGDAGSTVTVTFSAALKAQVTVAAYTNTSASPIEKWQSSTDLSATNHTAPALSGLTNGTWVVSLFTDKNTGTTAWTVPSSETKRADVYGTSGGAISGLVADSGGPVSGGSYPAQTAATNDASGSAAEWSIALQPAS